MTANPDHPPGAAVVTAVPPLFEHLVDDAGMFPPAELPVAVALRRHLDDAAMGHPMLTHRFVCTLDHVESFPELIRSSGVDLSLIVRSDDLDREARLRRAMTAHRDQVRSLELRASDTPTIADPARLGRLIRTTRDLVGAIPVFVETGWDPGLDERLALLAGHGACAKVRCGGIRPDLFPTEDQVGRFVVDAHRHRLSWKATAGLHRAVRSREESDGQLHHGFLNLLAAAVAAHRGADAATVTGIVGQTGTAPVLAVLDGVDDRTAHDVRESFVSYGSCDTREPVAELERLELVPRADAPAAGRGRRS